VDVAGRRAVRAAGITAAQAIAFQTAGKATRDAVCLSVYPVTALPVPSARTRHRRRATLTRP
jgi:hypothetical protein